MLVSGGDDDRKVKLWELATRKQIATFEVTDTGPARMGVVAISPDGKTVAGSSPVQFWDVATGENTPFKPDGGVGPIAYSPDGNYLAFFATKVCVFDLQKKVKRPLCEDVWEQLIENHEHMRLLSFTPDGKLVFLTVANATDRTVALWDAETCKKIRTFGEGERIRTYGVALSADAKVLASMGHDNKVRLWDVASGKNTVTVDAHVAESYLGGKEGTFPAMCLSADAKLLATADLPEYKDKTGRNGARARIYDAKTGKELAQLKGHSDVIASVAFSPDGKLIATGSLDGSIKIWSLPEAWTAKSKD
jgi:WD40 repeat protein